jgi:putative endonuclease
MRNYYVYMLANRKGGTLYIGVTADLIKRVHEHKTGAVEGFTKDYRVHDLVWFDTTSDVISAISREKQMKAWKRAWKVNLIEERNPDWKDLYETIT